MSWVDDYKEKLVTAEEAVSEIKTGDRVYISGNAATPYVLMNSLARRKDKLEEVELVHVLLLGEDPLSKPEMEGHFRHNSLFVGPADRKAINEGRADYIPIFLHQIPNLIYSEQMPLDVKGCCREGGKSNSSGE
jgi:acyl-CoA hydrolase